VTATLRRHSHVGGAAESAAAASRRRRTVIGLLAYVALAVLLTHNAWGDPSGRWIGVEGDPGIFIWDLRWVPFALGHGYDPLVTNYLHAPAGVNLMWNTSILLPALLMAPVTLAFGPVASYNVLSVLALAGSAGVAFLVFRRWARPSAAWVGALVYGFSPLIVSETFGHPQVTILLLPPLVLALYHDVLRGRRSPVAAGALAGVLVAAQLLTGEELLAETALAGLLGLLWLAVLARDQVRRRVEPMARALGATMLVALVLGGVPLAVQFFGPHQVHGPLQPFNVFVLDLEAPFVPTDAQWLHSSGSVAVAHHWTGFLTEANGYLGLLLPVLIGIVIVLRREPVVRWAGGLAAALALLALGPSLHVDGRDTGLPLPWKLAQHVPLAKNAIPSRLMLLVYLLAGLLAAIAIDRLLGRRGAPRWLGLTAVGAALVSLIPTPHYPATPAGVPAYFHSAVSKLPPGIAAVVSPYVSTRPMVWQAESGMRFRITGGYLFTQTRFGAGLNVADSFAMRLSYLDMRPGFSTAVSPADRSYFLKLLRGHRVGVVIVGPSAGQRAVAAFMTNLLGRQPGREPGGVLLFPTGVTPARSGV